jgi:type I restriction enzyme, S subunit
MNRQLEDIKIPQIRFKGFTDAWEQRNIKELGKVFIGLVTTMTTNYTTEGTLLIRNSDIKENKFSFSDDPIFLESKFAQENASRMLKIGDVVTVHTGDVGTSAVIRENEENSIGFATINTRPNQKIINPDYLSCFFNTDIHRNFAVNMSTGDGRTNYNLKEFNQVMVPLPNLSEQKQIASIILTINQLITLHQRKHDKIVNIKMSLLDKMFPKEGQIVPELRFKGFTDAWEQCELESLALKLDNLRVPVSEVDRVPGPTPYYGANGIQGYVQGYTHKGEFILVAEDGANDLKNYPVQYVNGEVWVNNHAHVLQGKLDFADTRYLGYAISQTNIEPFLVGGGRAKLNASTMMKIMISSPQSTQEQQRIGSLFDSIDSLITLHQRKLEKLKNVKKSLLDKIFV